jgi:hypothetical protein
MPQRNTGTLVATDGGGVAWWSDLPAAVAPGSVRASVGAAYQVDGADPRRLTAWSASSTDHLNELAMLLSGAEWLDQASEALASPTLGPIRLAMPAPADAAARLGLVHAVGRWYVRPVDISLLDIDEALAWHDAGRDRDAARLFSLSARPLVDLCEDALDGGLPAPASSLVSTAAQAAAGLLSDDHPDVEEVRDLAVQLAARDVLSSLSLSWAPARLQPVRRAGGLSLFAEFVDLSLVPPRLLAWSSARDPEIIVAHHHDADEVEITVGLADGVLAEDADVKELTVTLADRDTGQTWSAAGLVADETGRAIGARLALFGRSPDTLVVTISSPEHEPRGRATANGRILAQVERYSVEAWTLRRTAAVLLLAGDQERAAELQQAAASAQLLAISDLSQLANRGLSSHIDPNWPNGAPITALAAAGIVDGRVVQEQLESSRNYAEGSRRLHSVDDAVIAPLLAEWGSVLRDPRAGA